jgi:hypothetical protein
MSSAPHAHDDDSHGHAFTGEPIRELPADEPRTPGWLPVLGVALFTLAAVYVLAGHATAEGGDGATNAVATAQADAPRTAAPVRAETVRAAPVGSGAAPNIRPLSPDQIARAKANRPAAQPAPAH